MTRPAYAQWLAHGRAHQSAQRPVDAMLCYRRAVREDPQGADAHFHLGEVLWQLGKMKEAISAWQHATTAHPEGLAAQFALAEASLALNDLAQAEIAAIHAVELSAEAPRAMLILATARLARASNVDADAADGIRARAVQQAAEQVLAALGREPALLTVPSLAGPLATTIDQLSQSPTRWNQMRRRLIEGIGALTGADEIVVAVPALLLALIAEAHSDTNSHAHSDAHSDAGQKPHHLFDWDAAATRPYGASEHDALRRMALAARRAGNPAAAADALARRYAEVCIEAFAASAPLPWPRRTAGTSLRVLVLSGPASVTTTVDALRVAVTAATWRQCEVAIGVIGGKVDAPMRSLAGTPEVIRIIELPANPGLAEAKYLAALDPDVLLDFAGLTLPVGPLLAQRPARAILTSADITVPVPVPLVDKTLLSLSALEIELLASIAAMDASSTTLTAAGLAALFTQAVQWHQAGNHLDAVERYDEVLALQPGYAPALLLRGALRRDGGDLEHALADFMAATTSAPRYLDARVAAAQAAIDTGQPALAVSLVENDLADAPGFAALWRVLGLAQLARGDGEKAAAVFEHALVFDMTDGETHYNHGVALQMQRRFGDAARAYQRALAFRPDLVAADFNLGVLFQEQGNVDGAIAAYTQVLRVDPRYAAAYKNLGEVLFAAGRLDEWRANFGRFEAQCPDSLYLALQALEVCQHSGDFERLEHYLDGLRHERFSARNDVELANALEELLYLLLFFDVEPDILHRFAHTYDITARGVYGQPASMPAERRPGRVRLGYLSADLRNHVMGKMIWQAVQHHDRTRFELYFYSLSTVEDAWTARFRGLADHFVPIGQLSEQEAAQRIAADEVDVLVDLSTHTKGAKPGILARKPARVQITHVASAGTVGLSAIDFKLTDHHADLPANQEYMVERLLPMEGCVYPYRHVAPAAAHPFHRDRLKIAADTIVIGAFVTPLKLSRRCLRLWTEVLQRIPRARLGISPLNPAMRSSYARLAASAGIAPERLLLIPQGRDDAENQARYGLIDFVLDTMPFGGVNGTIEALDMGVPVVTLCGRKHGERTSYSILANLGVLETVAMSGPEYVALAVRLADDPAFMTKVRGKIRDGLASSPLTDMVRHTRHLEAAYEVAYAAAYTAAVEQRHAAMIASSSPV